MASKAATALGVAGFGVILLWSGVTNTGLLLTFRSLIQGTQPVPGAPMTPSTQTTNATPSAFMTSNGGGNAAIANRGLYYLGGPYIWGGVEPPPQWGGNGKGMDCYGLLTRTLRDLGYQIYPGNAHPGYLEYLAWNGATKVPGPPLPGDLILWPSHSGIAVSSTEMVSAENSRAGIRVDTFANGGPGVPEPMTILRVNGQTIGA